MSDAAVSRHTVMARAHVPDVDYAPLRLLFRRKAAEYEFTIARDDAAGIAVQTIYGTFGAAPGLGGADLEVKACRRDWTFTLKDMLVADLAMAWPEAAASLRWSDGGRPGDLPANTQIATVSGVVPLCRDFLRVTLFMQDLSRFTRDAVHFRLGLPPTGLSDPEWPRTGANGGTLWPAGRKALHCPVYTARSTDLQSGTLSFDLFEHDGGRATEWARTARRGAQVAVIGPGGGGVPDASYLLAFADETAFPAIARIIEDARAPLDGRVTLLADGGAQCGYPIPVRPGVDVTWLDRSAHASLVPHALHDRERAPAHFLWFAGEKQHAAAVRRKVKASPGTTREKYVAAYWQDDGDGGGSSRSRSEDCAS